MLRFCSRHAFFSVPAATHAFILPLPTAHSCRPSNPFPIYQAYLSRLCTKNMFLLYILPAVPSWRYGIYIGNFRGNLKSCMHFSVSLLFHHRTYLYPSVQCRNNPARALPHCWFLLRFRRFPKQMKHIPGGRFTDFFSPICVIQPADLAKLKAPARKLRR